MTTELSAESAAPATPATDRATDVRRGNSATAAATRGCVTGDGDIGQGQVTEVDNTAAHRRRSVGPRRSAVAGYQALGDDQAIQGRGDPGVDLQYLGFVLPAEGHVRHTIIVAIAVDGEVLADDQLAVEVDRHVSTEGHGIPRHRGAQGLPQAADTAVAIIEHRDRRQAVLIPRHAPVGQRGAALDGAGGDFQGPVAARAGAVAGRGNIAPGQLRQRVDKVDAPIARCRVAGVDQDVAADVHVLPDLRQHLATSCDVVCR